MYLAVLWRPALAATLSFGAAEGKVTFHNVASLHEFDGAAQAFSGVLDTAALRGDLTIKAASLTTWLGPRDDRLKVYCLNTEEFPEIRFQVLSVTGAVEGLQTGAGAGALTLLGTLTIRGVERRVSVASSYAWEGDGLRLSGDLHLKWADWGIPDPAIVISVLAPEMTASFNVLARPSLPTTVSP